MSQESGAAEKDEEVVQEQTEPETQMAEVIAIPATQEILEKEVVIDPEVLAIAADVIDRIKTLIRNNDGDLFVFPNKKEKKSKLVRAAAIRHVVPKGDVESKVALLELVKNIQKAGISIMGNPEEIDKLQQTSCVELNFVTISEIDEERNIRFKVDNKGRYDIRLAISIYTLKGLDAGEGLFDTINEDYERADEDFQVAKEELKRVQKSKNEELIKEAKKHAVEMETQRGRIFYRRERLEKGKAEGQRYLDETLCQDVKKEDASEIISALIANGHLMESDRERINKLFLRCRTLAEAPPDINIRFAREVQTFYGIIRKVHAALDKLKLL